MEEPKELDLDPEADPIKILTLKDLAHGCEKLLKTLSTQNGAQPEPDAQDPAREAQHHWATRELAEFTLWCVKVGVYGEGLRSIDVRLKDVPEICQLLKLLLESLTSNLQELQRGTGQSKPNDTRGQKKNDGASPTTTTETEEGKEDDSDASDSSSLSFDTLSSSERGSDKGPKRTRDFMLRTYIEDTINQLHGHAKQIHSAGSRHRMERIRRYQKKPELQGVYDCFKELCLRRMANDSFKLASDVIKSRVAESFARRRIRFKYLEEHQKKREIEQKPQAQPNLHRQALGQGFRASSYSGAGQRTAPGPSYQPKPPTLSLRLRDQASTILSATVDTKLDLKTNQKPQRAESVASVALRYSGFPPPPIPVRGKFQCPYCRLEFGAREAGKDRWSKHVMQDFEPYFCLVETCKSPFDVPNSFDGLLAHMQGHVPVKHHVDLPGGEHRELDDGEFESYIQSSGKQQVSGDMLAPLKEASRRRGVFLFDSCPFCGGYPDDVEKEFPDRDKPEAQSKLRSHIKRHMQEAALFYPPHRDDLPIDDAQDQGSAITAKRSDTQTLPESPEDFVAVCGRPDCKDCQLDANDVFPEDELPPDMPPVEADFWSVMHNSETGLTLLYDRSSPPKDYFLQSDHEHLHVFQHHGKRRTRKTSRPNSSDLSTEIHAKLCKSAFDDQSRDFLPEGAIDSLITEDAIRKKLGVLVDDPINVEIVHFVLKRAKRLFVIAILAGLTSGRRESEDYGQLATAMLDFQFAEMDDSCLPILFDDTRTQRPFYDEDEEIMDPWDPVKIRNFSRDQWTVLVPVLLHNGPMLDLHPNCILPIIEKETVASGGFSEVIRVRIHEQHLLGPITKFNGQPADMALKVMKQVYSDDKTEANQLDAVWERELYAYDNLRHHPHPNMIEFIAAIRRGVDRFLLFRWADGGNLRRFWTLNKQPLLNSALVKDVIFQLRGLTGALQQFHNLNYRHGDLKPENILCAFEQAPEAGRLNVPVMKISDLGLARRHFATTQLRDNRTSTNCTTVRYEPPEAELEMYSHAPRSRRYDMWSFGCIILEMIIWLISGNDSLDKFHRDLDRTGEYKSGSALFVTKLRPDGSRTAHIHPHVEDTMEALASSLGGLGNTAVEELLKIVKERLLVVALAGRSRWDSSQLLAALNGMVERGNANPSYWSIQRSLSHEGLLAMPILSEDIVVDLDPPENWKSDKVKPTQVHLDVTEHPVDNTFAEEAYRALRASDMSEPIEQPPSRLCVRCRSLDLSNPEFRCLETISGLQREQDVCDFCKLRLQACRKLNVNTDTIIFRRVQSKLILNGNPVPALSIFRSPDNAGISNKLSTSIQIGLTSLPEAGSESHFAILRQWLHDCDDNHPQCQPHTSREGATAPTRLLDVGTAESWTVRLVETNTYESYNYLVLSYCWGIVANLRTLPENYQQHSQGIDIESLPKTIRDAVITTRALKHRYLWVDSLCIIQGPDGDFKEEAGRLEEVYSSAHCVLAASSARDTSIGFLTNRNQPGFVHLPPPTASNAGTSSLYVCDFIDDFDKHALGGNLAQRGWSLQDRALARRTIYLTDVQTYFECGNGVRCETLAKLENKMHSFLGDPHFPSRLSSAVVDGDEKIRYYQHLYRQYSRMHFTFPTDRAVAIAGMEQRMSREMKVKGGYGVFDDGSGGTMLLRSLLWRRAAGQDALKRFTEAPLTQNRRLPTWSWMAYEGAIDYLDPPSESSSLEWIKGAITADWDWDENQCEPLGPPLLSATSHRLRYTLATSRVGGDVEIILDDGESGFDRMAQEWTQCGFVILATRKLPGGGEKMHYVLILAPRIDQGANTKEYERVGVGRVPGRWLSTYHADLVFII